MPLNPKPLLAGPSWLLGDPGLVEGEGHQSGAWGASLMLLGLRLRTYVFELRVEGAGFRVRWCPTLLGPETGWDWRPWPLDKAPNLASRQSVTWEFPKIRDPNIVP